MSHRLIQLLCAVCLAACGTVALAQGADASPPPAAAAESNAERAKTQPYNNAPFWREVRGQQGVTNLPGHEKGVLIQPVVDYPGAQPSTAGEAWRTVRNRWIVPYGGALLVIVLLALALLYTTRGPIGVREPPTGRRIERFTPLERAVHWTNAIAFCVLAVSGLVMAFGKFLLLPLIGGALFGWFTYALKTVHNLAGPLFAVSLAVMFVTYLRDNWPARVDLAWLRRGGGILTRQHVPAGRFNAGEKIVFWGGVFLLGIVVVGSGLVLDRLIPGLGETRGDMQVAHMVHAVATVLMMGLFLGHIYLGTIGMTGAYDAMRHGYVDESWAREHHQLWAEDVAAGKVPAQRSAAPGQPAAPAH